MDKKKSTNIRTTAVGSEGVYSNQRMKNGAGDCVRLAFGDLLTGLLPAWRQQMTQSSSSRRRKTVCAFGFGLESSCTASMARKVPSGAMYGQLLMRRQVSIV